MEATMMSKTMLLKEKLVGELRKNVKDLERSLEQAQKENGALEKEMEVKNVELQFYRKSMDSSHRQHFENLQKISKLESDCVRLARNRHLVAQPYQSLPHECLSNCLESLRALEEENKCLRKLVVEMEDGREKKSVVERDLEMSLMDDFVEVEKLAMELSPCMEIVAVNEVREEESDEAYDWLQDAMKAISKEQRISKRGAGELIRDLRIALGCLEEDEVVGESLPEKINGMELLEESKSKEMKEAADEYKLAVTKSKLQEILQKVASLEIELEHKSHRCEELEASCLELQLVLEGLDGGGNDAGEKMRAVAMAEEGAIGVIVEGKRGSAMRRYSLREQIEAENNARAIVIRQRKGRVEAASFREMRRGQYVQSQSPFRNLNSKSGKGDGFVGTMVSGNGKKQGFNLWRKLLLRRESGRKRMAR